jgi:glycosyltransferase involved in cell wall biosynthesis
MSKFKSLATETLSIIIPCFNQERWISRAISSVLAQSHLPHEVIVVDDGSTDGSLEIIESFGPPVRVIRQANAGASAARNTGLRSATGSLCFFLDGDDYVEGDVFAAVHRDMNGADFAVSPCVSETEDGNRSVFHRFSDEPVAQAVFERWLDFYSQPPCTVYWKTAFIRAIGGWDERVSLNDDGEVSMRAMLHEPVIRSIRQGFGVYNAHSGPSLSKTRSEKALRGELDAMLRLIQLGDQKGWKVDGFRRKLYGIARAGFQIENAQLGSAALKAFKTNGGKGHYGTFPHVCASTLLGLETKMRLSGFARK